eukprot:c18268_g1_i2.p1 GENE.c18268_g1_i2~~c18268_g1_i2.p1  ORF type:complete len:489 (+),score=69.09 c18268_g1_i2:28-1467(+)
MTEGFMPTNTLSRDRPFPVQWKMSSSWKDDTCTVSEKCIYLGQIPIPWARATCHPAQGNDFKIEYDKSTYYIRVDVQKHRRFKVSWDKHVNFKTAPPPNATPALPTARKRRPLSLTHSPAPAKPRSPSPPKPSTPPQTKSSPPPKPAKSSTPRKADVIEIGSDNECESSAAPAPRARRPKKFGEVAVKYPANNPEVQLTYSDLQRLEFFGFLNDGLMQFYLTYLEQQHSVLQLSEPAPFLTFNTFFFTKLQSKHPKDMKRWFKNVNVFKTERVFIPVHSSIHWSLAVICNLSNLDWTVERGDPVRRPLKSSSSFDGPIILYLDSLGGSVADVSEPLYRFLSDQWEAHGLEPSDLRTFVPIIKCEVPHQKNHTDCGLYVLKYVELMMQDFCNQSCKGLPLKRLDWFGDDDIKELRIKILQMLEDLCWEQKGGQHDPSDPIDGTLHVEEPPDHVRNKLSSTFGFWLFFVCFTDTFRTKHKT